MKHRITLVLAAVMAFAAPASAGGHKEKEIAPGIWSIRASASAAQGGHDAARRTVQRRAATLLGERGFTYVRILDSGGFSLDSADGSYSPTGIGPGYATLVVRGATGPEDVAGCRARRKDRCVTRSIHALMAM